MTSRALRRTTGILGVPLVSFCLIGAFCTVAFAALYNVFRGMTGPLESNLIALGLTMGVNFAANRAFTFRATTGPLRRQMVRYAVAYLIGLGASTAVLDLGLRIAGQPSRREETLIALGSGVVATVIRFVLMSNWVFQGHSEKAPGATHLLTTDQEWLRDH